MEDTVSRRHETAAPAEGAVSAAEFMTFCLQHRGSMLRWAVASGAHLDEAPDIVQEVLMGVWKRWATLAQPAAYAHKAVRFAAIDHHRRQTRRPEVVSSEVGTFVVDRQDMIAAVDDRLAIENLRATLNPREERVLVLMLNECPTEDIARDLGVSTATAYAYRSRLRKKIRSLMNDEVKEDDNALEKGRIDSALKLLTNRQRNVFDLRVQGVKPAQIAERLGMSEGNVGVTTHNAATKVAKALGLKGPFEALAHVRAYLGPGETQSNETPALARPGRTD